MTWSPMRCAVVLVRSLIARLFAGPFESLASKRPQRLDLIGGETQLANPILLGVDDITQERPHHCGSITWNDTYPHMGARSSSVHRSARDHRTARWPLLPPRDRRLGQRKLIGEHPNVRGHVGASRLASGNLLRRGRSSRLRKTSCPLHSLSGPLMLVQVLMQQKPQQRWVHRPADGVASLRPVEGQHTHPARLQLE